MRPWRELLEDEDWLGNVIALLLSPGAIVCGIGRAVIILWPR